MMEIWKELYMRSMIAILVMLTAASATLADQQPSYTYTYGPGTNFEEKTLTGSQSILVNGGGGDYLTLFDWTRATITSTTHLVHPHQSGQGIQEISMGGYSRLTVTGGEIGELYIASYGNLVISGGTVEYLRCAIVPPIPAVPTDKYIQVICKSYSYNSGTKKLSGTWADDSAFNIQLVDASPWPSGFTFDSINFTIVPEPMTVALLAAGGLLVRRYGRIGGLS